MMLPHLILYLLAGLLMAAACQDIARLTISNIFPVLVILLFPAWVAVVGPQADIWMNGVNFLVILGIGMGLFSMGWLGGGDVKLFAAVALWFDFSAILQLTLYIAAAGGALAVMLTLLRRAVPAGVRDRFDWAMFERRGPIPYGVAIAVGALLCVFLHGVNPGDEKQALPGYIASGTIS